MATRCFLRGASLREYDDDGAGGEGGGNDVS